METAGYLGLIPSTFQNELYQRQHSHFTTACLIQERRATHRTHLLSNYSQLKSHIARPKVICQTPVVAVFIPVCLDYDRLVIDMDVLRTFN